ncbi:MAG: ATP synthase F1 subunit epsilon [Clostridiales bacterium]|nr:ATP synthase F1 subunit epsilon [Clostridiales bacterium]
MPKPFHLEIITPSKTFYRGQCEIVIVPTPLGEEGFMADHAWVCALLDAGELWIREPGETKFKAAFIAGGFIDVKGGIVIFTDAAEWREEIDVSRAEARKADAEAWLKDDSQGEHKANEVARAEVAIARAIQRMKVAKGGFRDE